jgi:drug/metabolite transporter (DMT)-like permease
MKFKRIGSTFILVFAALIWGVAFVAQSVGMEFVGPFTFNTARSVLGGTVLIPCILILDKTAGKPLSIWGTKDKEARKTLLKGGLLCGTVLAIASALQQIGIVYTSVGKAGFISALYIVIIPLFGLYAGRRVSKMVWASVVIATVGMYFLCMNESFVINIGDFLIFLCAIVFSLHILIIDHFAPKVDAVRMSCIQFFVCAAVGAIPMLITESPDIKVIASAWQPIVYAGVLSSGVAYTLQIVAQKNIPPVVASLIFSLESVFAALAGWIILGQDLTARELLGSLFVFAAIILSQLNKPDSEKQGSVDIMQNNA